MILCKDCKFYTIPNLGYWFLPVKGIAMCTHPTLVSKVDGKPESYCSNQRAFDFSACGPSAKLFERKDVK